MSIPVETATESMTISWVGGVQLAVEVRKHRTLVDQPVEEGGLDQGMTPVEMFVASLGTCIGYFAVRFCQRHKIPSARLKVTMEWDYAEDPHRIGSMTARVDLTGKRDPAMTTAPSVVILGVGNTLMQDDGIGVWAVRSLAERYEFPPQVQLIEAGIAGLRLLSYLDGEDHLLIIDAVERGGPPGTIYYLTPSDLPKGRGPFLSAHEVGISELLSVARFLGKYPHILILGVQPLEVRTVGLELSPPLKKMLPRVVAAAVEELRALGVELTRKTLKTE